MDDCIILCDDTKSTTSTLFVSTTTTPNNFKEEIIEKVKIVMNRTVDNIVNDVLTAIEDSNLIRDVSNVAKKKMQGVLSSRNNIYIFIAVLCTLVGGIMSLLSFFAGRFWYREWCRSRSQRLEEMEMIKLGFLDPLVCPGTL